MQNKYKFPTIDFIRPTRSSWLPPLQLTAQYAVQKWNSENKVVQIMLDNCSIQHMEYMFDEVDSQGRSATIEDVEKFGLAPLVELLNVPTVCLSANGLDEMPGIKITQAYKAYERFCNEFWPGHVDDSEATYEPLDRVSKEKRVNFNDLPDDARRVYGISYVCFLHYQQIYRCHFDLTPEQKFEMYLYGVVHYLDLISAFELEIMKYLLWEPNRSLHLTPSSVQERYKK